MSKREYMHQWLKADAVCYDMPTEEIIQQLANENEEFETELKTKDERIKELKVALRKYGDHLGTCYKNLKIGDCNCGFKKALKGK